MPEASPSEVATGDVPAAAFCAVARLLKMLTAKLRANMRQIGSLFVISHLPERAIAQKFTHRPYSFAYGKGKRWADRAFELRKHIEMTANVLRMSASSINVPEPSRVARSP